MRIFGCTSCTSFIIHYWDVEYVKHLMMKIRYRPLWLFRLIPLEVKRISGVGSKILDYVASHSAQILHPFLAAQQARHIYQTRHTAYALLQRILAEMIITRLCLIINANDIIKGWSMSEWWITCWRAPTILYDLNVMWTKLITTT